MNIDFGKLADAGANLMNALAEAYRAETRYTEARIKDIDSLDPGPLTLAPPPPADEPERPEVVRTVTVPPEVMKHLGGQDHVVMQSQDDQEPVEEPPAPTTDPAPWDADPEPEAPLTVLGNPWDKPSLDDMPLEHLKAELDLRGVERKRGQKQTTLRKMLAQAREESKVPAADLPPLAAAPVEPAVVVAPAPAEVPAGDAPLTLEDLRGVATEFCVATRSRLLKSGCSPDNVKEQVHAITKRMNSQFCESGKFGDVPAEKRAALAHVYKTKLGEL